MEQLSFNSSVNRDCYAVIKDEAFKLGVTVKSHISAIVTAYAEQRRKEGIPIANKAEGNKATNETTTNSKEGD